MPSRFWQKIFLYLRLPEMRLFWYLLPLIFVIAVVDAIYIPAAGIWISISILVVLAVIVFLSSLRLARLNFEIKVERNELMGIIAALQDGVITYDPNFKIVVFNGTAENIFNLKSQEVMGQYFSPERAKEPKFSLLTQVIFPSLASRVIRRSDPGIYPNVVDCVFEEPKLELRVVTNKIVDSRGALLGFVKVIHDRTREVEIIRSKDKFIEVAAHQLRTPLTAITWSLESLNKENLTEKQKETAKTGFLAAVNLMKTVNDFLDISKIEEGKFGYQFEETEINGFAEGLLGEFMDLAKQSKVRILFKKAPEAIKVWIDRPKLAIALSNLLTNAVKYNVENGEIIVEINRVENKPFVQISVKDTGIGVPPEQIDKLFTKFFRAENAQRAVPDGIGLGLYITKNIIRAHGGEIWAESEINRGSVFNFALPTEQGLVPVKEISFGAE